MFTYPGYVTVNIFGGLLNHNCNGKEEVKKKNSHQEYPHTKQNKPHFMRCGRIGARLYDLYKSPVSLFRVGRPGAIAAGRRVGRELDPRKDARPNFTRIGPLQLVIHVVQNRHAGEQKSHWNKNNKENYHFKLCMPFLSCSSATFALQHGGFVPREWLAAKGLLANPCLHFLPH